MCALLFRSEYLHLICPLIFRHSKDHALDGHALSLFLVDALLDALRELKDHKDTNSTLLDELIAEDTALHEKLVRGPLPDVYKNVVDQNIQ